MVLSENLLEKMEFAKKSGEDLIDIFFWCFPICTAKSYGRNGCVGDVLHDGNDVICFEKKGDFIQLPKWSKLTFQHEGEGFIRFSGNDGFYFDADFGCNNEEIRCLTLVKNKGNSVIDQLTLFIS